MYAGAALTLRWGRPAAVGMCLGGKNLGSAPKLTEGASVSSAASQAQGAAQMVRFHHS
jgi:hypothetical protein